MPIKLKQVRQCSIGATSDPLSVNATDWLDSGETISSGTVAIIAGGSTGITLGSVAATTATYVEAETGVTVAASVAARFTVTATTSVARGVRTLELTLSTSVRSVPFELDLNIL